MRLSPPALRQQAYQALHDISGSAYFSGPDTCTVLGYPGPAPLPELDYPLTGFVMEGARRALLSMAEIQFAAGARQVLPVHEMARPYGNWKEVRAALAGLPMKPLLTRVVSTHVMGGCGLAGRPELGVTRPDGVHWQLQNLSIHDGSLFPTSVGANPQLSIYGIANLLAQELARRSGAGEAILA